MQPDHVQGVKFEAIANQFGTPVYIYDADVIKRQVQSLKDCLASTDLRIKFAAKALTNISILSLLKSLGVGIDAVSVNEVRIALQCGYKPNEINYTPNCVNFAEIE